MPLSVMAGASRSMAIPLTVALASLPATSIALPLTDWPGPLAVSVTSSGHTATPDRGSEQVKCTFTGPTYQPPAPSWPLTIAPVIDGAVLSSLTVTASLPRLPAISNASPSTERDAVSAVTATSGVVLDASTPEPPSLSLASKWTVTSDAFHWSAFGDGATVWVTIGAMLSYFRLTPFLGSRLPALSTAWERTVASPLP